MGVLWCLDEPNLERWLSWKMHPSMSPRLYAETLIGGGMRNRDFFRAWLVGTFWMVMLQEPTPAEGWSEFAYRWACRAWADGQQLLGYKEEGRAISVDIGLIGIDDLDLSRYIESVVAAPD